MRAPRIFRTLAFRIVAVYLTVFAISAAAIVGFTYWNTARALNAQTDQIVETDISGLAERYQRFGLAGLTDAIVNRSAHGAALYLLSDSQKRPIVGNLDAWPELARAGDNYVEFDYERRVGSRSEERRARGREFTLTGGFQLLVARDIAERYQTEKLFSTTLPYTLVLMVLLGLVGGIVISRNFLARLDLINRTSREIMAGDLSRRLPLGHGGGDEFDTLARNLNRMLERTERLMRGMRDVTDSIAHDLRTPLNRLRNRLEGVLHSVHPESTAGREIEAAVGETDGLIATFNALLLIAEAEAGVAREAMAPVDLRAIVDGVAELYAPLAEEKDVALAIAPSGSAIVQCNQSLVSQALANLIDNAIKYTPSGGRVTISVEHTPAGIALRVADTGPGIPQADRSRVLERFVRLEASRHSPGTGLGLSLVAAVARLHDAKLELVDNGPGLKASLVFPAGRKLPALARPPAQKLPARAAE